MAARAALGKGVRLAPFRLSRDGDSCFVDFAAVHLDGTVEEDVVDPNNPSRTITVKYLVGTISRRIISYVGGAPQSASGVGGDTVVTTHLAW